MRIIDKEKRAGLPKWNPALIQFTRLILFDHMDPAFRCLDVAHLDTC